MSGGRKQAGFVLPLTVVAVLLLALGIAPIFDGISSAVDRVQRGRDRLQAVVDLEEISEAALIAAATQGGRSYPELILDGRVYTAGTLRVSVQDLRGLVPLEGIDASTLRRLLIALGINAEHTTGRIRAYFDVIEADDLARDGGSESDAYRAAGLPLPRNAALATAAEAMAILTWRTEEFLWRDQAWERAVVARGPGGFNPQTAPRAALMALGQVSEDLADAILAARGSAADLLPLSAKRGLIDAPSGSWRVSLASEARGRRLEFRIAALDLAAPWRVDWSLPVPVSTTDLPRTDEDLPNFPFRIDARRP